jgi:cell division protein FtsQ
MLRDLRPLRTSAPTGWPFGSRRNRRLRAAEPRVASVAGQTAARALICAGIAATIGLAALGARLFLLRGRAFALDEIRVRGAHHIDADRLATHSGLARGSSLFGLDLAAVERNVSREPWVATVRAHRELPHTVVLEVVEREPRVAVVLGAIYLVDEAGEPFKRARAEELHGLPIVTGLQRDRFLADPGAARATLRRAIELDRTWRTHGTRPAPGELHHDGLGAPDATTPDRLRRLDAVMAALDRDGARPAFIHLDQRTSIDRIAVRLASTSDAIQAL